MTRCPVCGSLMRSVALTALEEAAQVYPHVSAAWRCAAWPACDTRRVEQQLAGCSREWAIDRVRLGVEAFKRIEDPDRPRDSDIGGPAWGTKR